MIKTTSSFSGTLFRLTIFFFCMIILPDTVRADGASLPGRPKIGLALSGGGARGAAHIGVLRVLQEHHIPIDYIAGTSMGAVIGGLYASGVPLEELETMATQTDWAGVFSDTIPRQHAYYWKKSDKFNYLTDIELDFSSGVKLPKGVVRGKRLDLLLRSLSLGAPDNFDDFPVPFRAIASDIETSEMVVLSSGDLARSLRASMAIPGAFAPVEIGGKMLVDGGVAQNLPISVVRKMGADIVIAVDIGTPLSNRQDLKNFLGVIDQITNILTNRNVQEEIKTLAPQDIYIKPDLGEVATASFDQMDKAIRIGEQAAREQKQRLAALSLNPEAYSAWRDERTARIKTLEKIDFVRIEQKSLLGSEFILKLIERSTKGVLRKDILAYDMFDFYKRGDFEEMDFKLQEDNGRYGLIIKQKEKNTPGQYLSFGIELSSNLDMDQSLQLLLKYSYSNINRLGGEWKNELRLGDYTRCSTEFHQPLNPYPWHLFMAPGGEYQALPVDLYQSRQNDTPTAQYKVYDAHGRLDLGLQMAQYGELRAGYLNGKTRTTVKVGPEVPDTLYDNGALQFKIDLDQLDNVYFPKQGWQITGVYTYGRERLGADESYRVAELSLLKGFSFDRHTLLFKAQAASNFDTSEALARGCFLGGPFNLSGLHVNQYYGRHMALAEAIYYARVASLSKFFRSDMHAGFSCEAGNIWEDRAQINSNDLILAGSLFFGLDTPIGPVFLGYGRAQGNCQAFYISLGVKYF